MGGRAGRVPRQDLLAILERYRRRFPGEAKTIARVRALVARVRDPFDRRALPGHVTASAWLVSPDGRRVVLVHHRKIGRWLQPGGHVEGDRDLSRAALREAREETGLRDLRFAEAMRAPGPPGGSPQPFDLDVHEIPRRAGEPAHEHHDVRYLLLAPPEQPLTCSDESHAVAWFTEREVRARCRDASVIRMMGKSRRILERRGEHGRLD